MDELIDILDTDGNMTGRTAMKSEAHKYGWFHNTVHIWFFTLDRKILFQQRGRNKDVFPLLWDVSVAGHIGAGEEIEISALREVKEEIGLNISKNQLKKIGVFKSVQKHNDNLMDYEFHHSFLCELKLPLDRLQKQESEVEDLQLISLIQFNKDLKGSAKNNYVPHGLVYYESIMKQIELQFQ